MSKQASAIKYTDSLLNLTTIFTSFNKNRDSEELIKNILKLAINITGAEGGTIYLVTNRKTLLFRIFINEVLGLKSKNSKLHKLLSTEIPLFDEQGKPREHHVCSHAFHQQKMVHVKNAYASTSYDFSGLKAFDKTHNYVSKSLLTVPIIGNDQKVIAILQLINAQDPKDQKCVPFSGKVQKTVVALAAISGLQIDNLQLIENLTLQIDCANRAQAEKDRLLRDLHDGIGSQLTKASIDLQSRALSRSAQQKIIDSALDEMRQIFNNYIHFDSSLIKMISLVVEQYKDLFKSKKKCSLRYKYLGEKSGNENFSRDLVVNLMQVLREILTNCLKHSPASIINIALIIKKNQINLIVIENRSINLNLYLPQIENGGQGHINIEYRVEKLLGGQISYDYKNSKRITKIEINRN